jgi:hypothetical protein
VDSSYSLGARLGWLTNKSTPLICGEHAVNETQNQLEPMTRSWSSMPRIPSRMAKAASASLGGVYEFFCFSS